jgi:hypothetical protein
MPAAQKTASTKTLASSKGHQTTRSSSISIPPLLKADHETPDAFGKKVAQFDDTPTE